MHFCSRSFILFLAAVLAGYWILPWPRARVWLLLGASFFFYACWNHWLAALIGVSTVLDYLLARGIEASASPGRRKLFLAVSLIANLGLLVYFKYADFFLHSAEDALHALGVSASLPMLRVIVPVGISFYTFEAISYTIDVYRRRLPAERSLANFMLFISFFPHLVAGPIVRPRHFLPQVGRIKRWDWARLNLGAQLFLMGLFKKLAIADRMALYVDPVFGEPGAYNSAAVWAATVAYAVQIYCDFSGYTDMALGSAHLFGYKLAPNFNLPYRAVNVADFWRRWHISLSSWLRDYLFIPLGGSRGGRWRTVRNLLATMALGGLWHGASWTFVVWGLLHGVFLVIHRMFRSACQRQPRFDHLLQTRPGTLARIGLTVLAVGLAWVFFRAPSFEAAAAMLGRLAIPQAGLGLPLSVRGLQWTVALVVVCHALAGRRMWERLMPRLPAPVIGFGYAAAASLALVLAPEGAKAFIYFQF